MIILFHLLISFSIEVKIYFNTTFESIQILRTSYSFDEIIDLSVYVYQDSIDKKVRFKKF